MYFLPIFTCLVENPLKRLKTIVGIFLHPPIKRCFAKFSTAKKRSFKLFPRVFHIVMLKTLWKGWKTIIFKSNFTQSNRQKCQSQNIDYPLPLHTRYSFFCKKKELFFNISPQALWNVFAAYLPTTPAHKLPNPARSGQTKNKQAQRSFPLQTLYKASE